MSKQLVFCTLVLIVTYVTIQAQITFGDQNIIIEGGTIDGPYVVQCYDLDGDGDLDVISASFFDDKISWFENIDGNGTFGPQQIITTETVNVNSIYCIDLDADEDIDLLSASWGDSEISWFENTDGNGTFGSQQIISNSTNQASSVYGSDLDGDGDMDVLSASYYHDEIAWYENNDGEGTFGPKQTITIEADAASAVYCADLDGDGDMDVLSASAMDKKIAWYKNTDGNGNFGIQQVITLNAYGGNNVYCVDVDGDGDFDVLSSAFQDDQIAWYENTDGNGTFGSQQIISIDADGAYGLFYGDLDSDGDIDVLSASFYDNKIAWYENTDGLGNFGPQQVITTENEGARAVYCGDLDGDGDLDLLTGSSLDDRVAWYENLHESEIEIVQQNRISVYPNPANSQIRFYKNSSIEKVEIYSINGIKCKEIRNPEAEIDVSDLKDGMYIVKIYTANGITSEKLIISKM